MIRKVLAKQAIAILALSPLIPSVAQTGAEMQRASALPIDDALQARSFAEFSPVVFSPDGTQLAYTVRSNRQSEITDDHLRTGVPGISKGGDIYLASMVTHETRRLTDGQSDSWMPAWSPDGHFLAYLSDAQGGQERVCIWDVIADEFKSEPKIAVRMDAGDRLQWTPDSRAVLVLALPNGVSIDEYVGKVSGTKPEDPAHPAFPGSSVVFYRSGAESDRARTGSRSDPWNLNLFFRDLVALNVSTGKPTVLVHGRKIRRFEISPDGRHVALLTPEEFEKPGSQQILFDFVFLETLTGQERLAASGLRLNLDGSAFSWSPDSLQLAFHTGGVEERNYDCYVLDVRGGPPRNVTNFAPGQRVRGRPSTPLWDAHGEQLYFLRQGALWRASAKDSKASEISRIADRQMTHMIAGAGNALWIEDGRYTTVITHDDSGKQDGFYKIDLRSGGSSRLLERRQTYTGVSGLQEYVAVSENGRRVAYFSEDARDATELWLSNPAFDTPQRLTNLNPQFDKVKLGESRMVDWLSDDGERLSGALLLPSEYKEGKRYPLIVWVYGGSALSDRLNRFGLGYAGPFNMQLLATRGYVVLLPDAPQHLGTPMKDLAKTVLPGVNKIIELGIADPARLGVMGHSYGGYSTLSLIVQTNRFRAAIAADGFGDLLSAYGQMSNDGSAFQTSIAEHGQGLMGDTPWQLRTRYIENSPFYYLDNIETPVLLIHGGADESVMPFLADEMFVGLRRLGKEVEYARYEGEGHSPTEWHYQNQKDYCERMLAWFQRYLESGGT